MNMEKLIAYAIEAIILTCCLIQSSKVIYFIILYGVRFFLGGMASKASIWNDCSDYVYLMQSTY